MKLSNLLFVLFFSSLLLLLPLTKPGSEYLIRPLENTQIIKSVQSPRVVVVADIIEPISLNVSIFDAKSEVILPVISTSFIERIEIDLNNRGYYLFEFHSGSLANIEIQEAGIFVSSLVIIGIFGLLVIANLVRKQFTAELVY